MSVADRGAKSVLFEESEAEYVSLVMCRPKREELVGDDVHKAHFND